MKVSHPKLAAFRHWLVASLTITLASIFIASLLAPPVQASHKSQYSFVSYSDGPWSLLYSITQTDGLLINHAQWYGIDQFRDLKLPQIIVEYNNRTPIIDQLGIGQFANNKLCPGYPKTTIYYDAGGTATGFGISAEFRFVPLTCGQFPPPEGPGYTYVQVYDFWYNGIVVPQVRIYGPGLENDARYHVYFRLDLSANGNELNFFEYYAITAIQYPPYEHDINDDEVYRIYPPYGYEWMNRDGPPNFKGYVSRPWLYSAWTQPPPNQNAYWVFVHVDGEQEGGAPNYDTEEKYFTNFPKAWDNNQPIDTAQDLVNWFASTVQASISPSYCKPTNHCGVGIWFTPFNY